MLVCWLVCVKCEFGYRADQPLPPILGFTVEALKLDNEAQNIGDYLRDIGSWNIFSAGIIVVSHIHVASHHSRL